MELIRYVGTVALLGLAAASLTRPVYLLAARKVEERSRKNAVELLAPLLAACVLCTLATLVAPYRMVNMFAWVFAILTVTCVALMVVIDWKLRSDIEDD